MEETGSVRARTKKEPIDQSRNGREEALPSCAVAVSRIRLRERLSNAILVINSEKISCHAK